LASKELQNGGVAHSVSSVAGLGAVFFPLHARCNAPASPWSQLARTRDTLGKDDDVPPAVE
jgi:hypothetical protein